MRRATLFAALAIPAVLAAGALVSALVPPQRLAALLEDRLCTARNVGCTIGSAKLSLLPWPQIIAQDVRVDLKGKPGLTRADRLTAELSLSSLFVGSPAFSTLTIKGADIVGDPKMFRGAEGAVSTLIEAVATQKARWSQLNVARVRITDARVLDLLGREWANSADVHLTLPGTHKAITLNASARWHGETVRLTLKVAQPFALAEGGTSEMLVGFNAPLMVASLEGIAQSQPAPQINGTFTAASPNPAGFAAWIDEHPALLPMWPVSTSGTARLARGTTTLTMSKFTIGKTDLDGNVSFRRDADGTRLTGTLATERLEIPTGHAGPAARLEEHDNNIASFLYGHLSGIDLRLSAARATIADFELRNLGLALIARDGKLDIVLASADFAGGTAKGRLGIISSEERVDARLQAHVEGIDLAQAMMPFGIKRMNGTLNAQAQIEARGANMSQLMRTLDGRIAFNAKKGDLVGVNVPEILRRIEKRPLVTALDIRGGRTPFESATGTLRIVNGIAEIGDGLIVSPATRIDFNGALQLVDRTLALKGMAAQPRGDGTVLPFEIKGSFDEPSLIPDARALIRRSGAAAPFFATPKVNTD